MPKPFIYLLLLIGSLISLSGCSTTGSDPIIVTAIIKFDIAYDTNPNELHRPSPVVIAMHQLKNGSAYLQANSLKMFQNPGSVLGGDIISTQKFGPYFPGTKTREKIILNHDAASVGFFAELSNSDNASEKGQVFIGNEDEKVRINVVVNGNGISVYRVDY